MGQRPHGALHLKISKTEIPFHLLNLVDIRKSVRICPISAISGPLNILLNPLITNFNQRLVAINRAKGTLTSNL